MRLLLDEMISSTVAAQLRSRGHDVVAVQDADAGQLRGVADAVVLDHAVGQRRAVVTDNIADVMFCHQQRLARDDPHYGLLLFSNDTFPRHRHDVFVRQVLAALDAQLRAYPQDDASSWIRWLERSP